MSSPLLHFGIDFGVEGPRVVANLDGVLLPLDHRLFAPLRDPWLLPVYQADNGVPDFHTLKSLLGRTDNLNFGVQKLRKPHFVFRDVFALLKQCAAEGFNRELGQVIVCTSAFYPEQQRSFLVQCAGHAGVSAANLIDANIAGAIAGLQNWENGLYFLVNLGFERCELALIELQDGKISSKGYQQSLKASGRGLSSIMLNSILLSLNQEQGSALTKNLTPAGWLRLFELCEQSKINLALLKNHEVLLDRSLTGLEEHLLIKFGRNDLNAVLLAAFDELNANFSRLLQETGVSEDRLQKAVLSGGGANIPFLRNLFLKKFGAKLFLNGDETEVRGCARWARIVAEETATPVALAAPVLPAISEEESDRSLIRGTVEIASQEAVAQQLRRADQQAEGLTVTALLDLVRERAQKLLEVSDRQSCARYLQSLDEIIAEFKPKANVALGPAAADSTVGAKISKAQAQANYRARIKRPSDAVKIMMQAAANATTLQEQGILFERAVNISHDIELWARQYGDEPRLKAVVQVHTKSAKNLMQGANWDGADETVFILARNWLRCALGTIHENKLGDATEEVRPVLGELYLKRIQYLVANNNLEEALELRQHYVQIWGEQDALVAEMKKVLQKQD